MRWLPGAASAAELSLTASTAMADVVKDQFDRGFYRRICYLGYPVPAGH